MSASEIFFKFEFKQLTPFESPHPFVQMVSLQLHLITLISRSGAGGKFVLIGKGLPFTLFHPHSRGLILSVVTTHS